MRSEGFFRRLWRWRDWDARQSRYLLILSGLLDHWRRAVPDLYQPWAAWKSL